MPVSAKCALCVSRLLCIRMIASADNPPHTRRRTQQEPPEPQPWRARCGGAGDKPQNTVLCCKVAIEFGRGEKSTMTCPCGGKRSPDSESQSSRNQVSVLVVVHKTAISQATPVWGTTAGAPTRTWVRPSRVRPSRRQCTTEALSRTPVANAVGGMTAGGMCKSGGLRGRDCIHNMLSCRRVPVPSPTTVCNNMDYAAED
jgi:hypothetical protein